MSHMFFYSHHSQSFFRVDISSCQIGLGAQFQNKDLKFADESGMSTTRVRGVCLLHSDRRVERQGGHLAGQNKAQISCMWGCSPVRTLWSNVNKPAYVLWGKKWKKQTQLSTYEKVEEDLLFCWPCPNLSAPCSQNFINNISGKLATSRLHLQFDEKKTWWLMASVESWHWAIDYKTWGSV